MKKIFLLFSTFVVILLFASSCTMHNRTTMGAPLEARVNFTSSDLEYIGEVTGTSTQYYVLGFLMVDAGITLHQPADWHFLSAQTVATTTHYTMHWVRKRTLISCCRSLPRAQ